MTTITDALNIHEVARFAGLGEAQIRAWTARYNWPQPSRDRRGRLHFTERQAIQLRDIAYHLRAGACIGDLIVDGQPTITPSVPPPTPIRIDISNLPRPQSTTGIETQRLLLLGIVQRHAGRIRHALAQCARLRPDERGPAVLLVLDAFRAQNPTHAAWLDQAIEG